MQSNTQSSNSTLLLKKSLTPRKEKDVAANEFTKAINMQLNIDQIIRASPTPRDGTNTMNDTHDIGPADFEDVDLQQSLISYEPSPRKSMKELKTVGIKATTYRAKPAASKAVPQGTVTDRSTLKSAQKSNDQSGAKKKPKVSKEDKAGGRPKSPKKSPKKKKKEKSPVKKLAGEKKEKSLKKSTDKVEEEKSLDKSQSQNQLQHQQYLDGSVKTPQKSFKENKVTDVHNVTDNSILVSEDISLSEQIQYLQGKEQPCMLLNEEQQQQILNYQTERTHLDTVRETVNGNSEEKESTQKEENADGSAAVQVVEHPSEQESKDKFDGQNTTPKMLERKQTPKFEVQNTSLNSGGGAGTFTKSVTREASVELEHDGNISENKKDQSRNASYKFQGNLSMMKPATVDSSLNNENQELNYTTVKSPSLFRQESVLSGSLQIEIERKDSQIKILTQKLKVKNDSNDTIVKLRKKLKELEETAKKDFQEKMTMTGQVSSMKMEIEIMNQQMTQMVTTIDTLNESIKNRDTDMDNVEDIRAELMQRVEDSQNNLQQAEEELYSIKKEMYQMVHDFDIFREQAAQELQSAKDNAAKQIDNIQKKAERVEKEATDHVAYYQRQNSDLLTCYVGRKKDTVDQQLASYIQSMPDKEKMKILFLRESEGIYRFGSRRVYLKIEKGKDILVRVGGGYIHIEDFIKKFTDSEVERIERKSVIDRFKNKIQAQKISVEQANEALEHSPIREPQHPQTAKVSKSPVRTKKKVPMAAATPRASRQSSSSKSPLRYLGQRDRSGNARQSQAYLTPRHPHLQNIADKYTVTPSSKR